MVHQMVLPLQVKADLRVMAMKGYSTFHKLQEWRITIRWFIVMHRTFFCGWSNTFQGCSLRILQPQPNGLWNDTYMGGLCGVCSSKELIFSRIYGHLQLGIVNFSSFFVVFYGISTFVGSEKTASSWKRKEAEGTPQKQLPTPTTPMT